MASAEKIRWRLIVKFLSSRQDRDIKRGFDLTASGFFYLLCSASFFQAASDALRGVAFPLPRLSSALLPNLKRTPRSTSLC